MAFAQQHVMRSRAHTVQRGAARVARPGPVAAPRSSRHVAFAAAVDETRFIPRWPMVYDFIKEKQVETVTPEAAASLVSSGDWVLVDVRRPDQFATGSPRGSVNVPMYRKIDLSGGFDGMKVMKTIMYAFNGVDPIEPNPEFVEQLAKAAEGGKGLIFACEACYKAVANANISKVKHLERGIYGWYQANLEFSGDYKPEIGRFPSAAAEPMLQAVAQSRGYELRPEDKRD
ncbi:rhodanese-like protein [Monoraphidium neglectum]|uniref:Rhodanese-like protein n=1 Tax=Monoraphidium neglectum TaxID=145388 RepID=A0A0D2JJ63_9CHLO|nr:rhodanese-like protein [Monoraphidium neglectum]KIY99352.1 rhodanese-like protein [Monoraphidium neglectum]|eukprot:XP_013898372.1 rhodanese-like protein [Monoraphidium neglectum]